MVFSVSIQTLTLFPCALPWEALSLSDPLVFYPDADCKATGWALVSSSAPCPEGPLSPAFYVVGFWGVGGGAARQPRLSGSLGARARPAAPAAQPRENGDVGRAGAQCPAGLRTAVSLSTQLSGCDRCHSLPAVAHGMFCLPQHPGTTELWCEVGVWVLEVRGAVLALAYGTCSAKCRSQGQADARVCGWDRAGQPALLRVPPCPPVRKPDPMLPAVAERASQAESGRGDRLSSTAGWVLPRRASVSLSRSVSPAVAGTCTHLQKHFFLTSV